jgi:hypothetical protein
MSHPAPKAPRVPAAARRKRRRDRERSARRILRRANGVRIITRSFQNESAGLKKPQRPRRADPPGRCSGRCVLCLAAETHRPPDVDSFIESYLALPRRGNRQLPRMTTLRKQPSSFSPGGATVGIQGCQPLGSGTAKQPRAPEGRQKPRTHPLQFTEHRRCDGACERGDHFCHPSRVGKPNCGRHIQAFPRLANHHRPAEASMRDSQACEHPQGSIRNNERVSRKKMPTRQGEALCTAEHTLHAAGKASFGDLRQAPW